MCTFQENVMRAKVGVKRTSSMSSEEEASRLEHVQENKRLHAARFKVYSSPSTLDIGKRVLNPEL